MATWHNDCIVRTYPFVKLFVVYLYDITLFTLPSSAPSCYVQVTWRVALLTRTSWETSAIKVSSGCLFEIEYSSHINKPLYFYTQLFTFSGHRQVLTAFPVNVILDSAVTRVTHNIWVLLSADLLEIILGFSVFLGPLVRVNVLTAKQILTHRELSVDSPWFLSISFAFFPSDVFFSSAG